MYTISAGYLQEKGTFLGGTFPQPGMNNFISGDTAYLDTKMVQHLGKDFYLLGHYSVGFATPNNALNFWGMGSHILQKYSLGLMKKGIFADDSFYFVFSEPNKVINNTNITLSGFVDSTGNAVTIIANSLQGAATEKYYEFGYDLQANKKYGITVGGSLI
jgi:hypothetical protein